MMLTTKSRYAVMALVDMAKQNRMGEGCDKATCLSKIAERQNITVAYLEQIFCKLKSANIVKSQRGPGGGYIFARPATEINIAEIILAVDEPIKMTRCGDSKNIDTKCAESKPFDNCEEKNFCPEEKYVKEKYTKEKEPNETGGCLTHNSKCSTHELWKGLENQIENYLKSVSLDDVASDRLKV